MKLLIGTKKGAFVLQDDNARKNWKLADKYYFGHIVNHFVADPRNPQTMLVAAKTGHLGPTVFRTTDGGKTWKESSAPPAFKPVVDNASEVPSKDTPGEHVSNNGKRAVDRVFWLTPGHKSEPQVWYAGTAPSGLFRSDDAGQTWQPIDGFNDNPNYEKWATQGGTPDGQFLHSIVVDSRDPKHLYFGISIGGIFESIDGGKEWKPLNKGIAADFLPDPSVEYGHDPHCFIAHPLNQDRLYHQNHCGIYRLDRPGNEWTRIGDNMPKQVGDIGFPIVAHPRNVDCVWVFPMDGTEVWPRTSPDGKPATYVTKDGGKSWKRQDKGLPTENGYFTVKRQCMTSDESDPVGLYFGTTSGEVWASSDEGESWQCIARHLPEIYSLAVAP